MLEIYCISKLTPCEIWIAACHGVKKNPSISSVTMTITTFTYTEIISDNIFICRNHTLTLLLIKLKTNLSSLWLCFAVSLPFCSLLQTDSHKLAQKQQLFSKVSPLRFFALTFYNIFYLPKSHASVSTKVLPLLSSLWLCFAVSLPFCSLVASKTMHCFSWAKPSHLFYGKSNFAKFSLETVFFTYIVPCYSPRAKKKKKKKTIRKS